MSAMAATDEFQPVSRVFTSQGLDLHYLDWGNDGAPLLLLLHGSRDHARSWDWTARALRHQWHVIAPDLRGHGTESWSTNAEEDGRAAHFRDRRTVVFENAGHWIHHDRCDAFIAALRDFL